MRLRINKSQKVAFLLFLMIAVNLVSIQVLREQRSSLNSSVDSNEVDLKEEYTGSYNAQQANIPNFAGYHNFFTDPFGFGDADIFFIQGSDVVILKNPGTPNASFDTWPVYYVSRGRSMQAALIYDVNKDGLKDIITSSAGQLYFFMSDGNVWKNNWNSSAQYFVIYSFIDQISEIQADDLDRDFDLDLVVISQNKTRSL